jgi:ribosomal protein L16 Arg81 hydroxylase
METGEAEMPEKSLRKILTELRELLDDPEQLDEESREALRETAGEIEEALEAEDYPLGAQLVRALRERIERFETSHPRITEAVRRFVDQLAEMGI